LTSTKVINSELHATKLPYRTKFIGMKIKKVTVFGTGDFGARIAFHIAYNQIDVTVYDQDYGLLEEARTRFREFGSFYKKQFEADIKDIEAALANIAYSIDIKEAAGNAQLIIEAVPEDLEVKKSFYNILKETAPKNSIFATTSQGLDLEALAQASGRAGKFINLHFTGSKDYNAIEIIGLPDTQKAVLQTVTEFSENIGLVPTVRIVENQE
jgi:3-hydroxyacyl-CoA dehydrogenase